MLSYTVNAIFSYTRTLQGLELKVCGLGLGLGGLDYITAIKHFRLTDKYQGLIAIGGIDITVFF